MPVHQPAGNARSSASPIVRSRSLPSPVSRFGSWLSIPSWHNARDLDQICAATTVYLGSQFRNPACIAIYIAASAVCLRPTPRWPSSGDSGALMPSLRCGGDAGRCRVENKRGIGVACCWMLNGRTTAAPRLFGKMSFPVDMSVSLCRNIGRMPCLATTPTGLEGLEKRLAVCPVCAKR